MKQFFKDIIIIWVFAILVINVYLLKERKKEPLKQSFKYKINLIKRKKRRYYRNYIFKKTR